MLWYNAVDGGMTSFTLTSPLRRYKGLHNHDYCINVPLPVTNLTHCSCKPSVDEVAFDLPLANLHNTGLRNLPDLSIIALTTFRF
jgi:hypothetical protein